MPLPSALRIIVITAAVIMTAYFGSPVFACQCIDLSPYDRFKIADLVFVGSAVAVNSGVDGTATLRVEHVLKGTPATQVVIASEGNDCDYSFQTGSSYVVYARQSDGKLFASTCLGTHVLLGLVTQQPIVRYTSSPRYGYRAAIAGVVLLLALAVGYIVGRASKRAA
jgi:hypothetical protein